MVRETMNKGAMKLAKSLPAYQLWKLVSGGVLGK